MAYKNFLQYILHHLPSCPSSFLLFLFLNPSQAPNLKQFIFVNPLPPRYTLGHIWSPLENQIIFKTFLATLLILVFEVSFPAIRYIWAANSIKPEHLQAVHDVCWLHMDFFFKSGKGLWLIKHYIYWQYRVDT